VTLGGSTAWDGQDQTLTGILPVGLYYYRVVAEDDAGNFTQSGQSIPIQIAANLPNLLGSLSGIVVKVTVNLTNLL